MPGAVVILVVGRPASGKRTVIAAARQMLEDRGVPTAYVSDSDYIDRVIADPAMRSRVAETEDGWVIVDRKAVFDEALRYLASGVAAEQAPVVFADFARSDNCQAIARLAELGCDPDIVVYLNVSIWTAVRRNEARRGSGALRVPSKVMSEAYMQDDLTVLQHKEARLLEIANDEDGEAAAGRSAGQIADAVKNILG